MRISLLKYVLLIPCIWWIGGCSTNKNSNETYQEFQFDKISIVRNNIEGEIAWQLDSPDARFDQDKKLIKAKKPVIMLYSQMKPTYDIKADSLTSFNNLDYVVLEGNILIQQIENQNISIKGDILRWDVKKGMMNIENNPIVYSSNSSISSENIIFDLSTNYLTFKGDTKSIIIPNDTINLTNDKLIINSKDTLWALNTGDLMTNNKVWGERLSDEPANRYDFVGNSLKANTINNKLNLYTCNVKRVKSINTFADECKLSLFVNSEDSQNFQPQKVNKYIFNKSSSKKEKLEFQSINNRVRSKLNIENLNTSIDLIE